MSTKDSNQNYFRVRYRKLETRVRLFPGLRCDMKFEVDASNQWVFSLYPSFEQFVDVVETGEQAEATNEGTAIIMRPFYEDKNGYYDMIRARVKVGAKAYFVGGSQKLAELEITEILNDL